MELDITQFVHHASVQLVLWVELCSAYTSLQARRGAGRDGMRIAVGLNCKCFCRVLQVEGIGIDEESLAYLGEIGERTSLRHAVQVGLWMMSLCDYSVVQTCTCPCWQHGNYSALLSGPGCCKEIGPRGTATYGTVGIATLLQQWPGFQFSCTSQHEMSSQPSCQAITAAGPGAQAVFC